MSDEVMPFLFGWKLSEIVVVEDHLHLRSGTVGVLVEPDARAHCFKHKEHLAPVANCACGFFARATSESLVLYARYPLSHLLEVELSGRVIAKRGEMRAEHQRILRLLLLPTCYRCGAVASMLTEPPPSRSRVEVFPAPALTSVCEECAGARWWLCDEIQSDLGIPVSWAVPSEALVLHGVGMNLGDH
ncbi:MAG TPA: hypothetical protein VNE42_07950 [Acidimicrobiales bacterium]|nr:hypothetical protein [Acidimicrobiales bacterium]